VVLRRLLQQLQTGRTQPAVETLLLVAGQQRRRMRRGRTPGELFQVAEPQPQVPYAGVERHAVPEVQAEQRAVQAARAGPRDHVDGDLVVPENSQQPPVRVVRGGVAQPYDLAARAAHPHREADAAAHRHRDPQLAGFPGLVLVSLLRHKCLRHAEAGIDRFDLITAGDPAQRLSPGLDRCPPLRIDRYAARREPPH
jgi:hypothetical protein